MDKRWTLAIVTLLMVLMIYAFLSMVLRTDKRKTTHTRMYRDYSNYGHKKSSGDDYSFDSRTYASSAEARKIKRNLFKNAMKVTSDGYKTYMKAALRNTPSQLPKSNGNPQYEEVMKLARKPLPELQSGLILFQQGDYEEALAKFDEALNKLDQMELKNRMELYNMIAECYIKLHNDDGYIQNKIRQVRIERKYKKLLQESFPQFRDKYPQQDFMTTQDATKNLLRVKSAVAKLPDSPMVREMLKKAELDLEVARKVTQ